MLQIISVLESMAVNGSIHQVKKHDNVSNVPLLDQAMDIIEKYARHPIVCQKQFLPMKSNQKLNAYLKELADICGISKPMTMHIASHTLPQQYFSVMV
ncbi:MAG: hypothetical protein IPO94_17890 [Saprospiraceae bacterium]|nr:hypothetical protein [Saprospiraceae bacterium]